MYMIKQLLGMGRGLKPEGTMPVLSWTSDEYDRAGVRCGRYVYICMNIYQYVCIYIFKYEYILYICIHICIYIYICTYMYIRLFTYLLGLYMLRVASMVILWMLLYGLQAGKSK
jgi:hypothetical protein